jgi:hypothetical protein
MFFVEEVVQPKHPSLRTRKDEILTFIKVKQRSTKEITTKFGNGGAIWVALSQLEDSGKVTKPAKGQYKC